MRSLREIPLHGEEYVAELLSCRDRYTALDFLWAGDGQQHLEPGTAKAEEAALEQGALRQAAVELIVDLFHDISLVRANPVTFDIDQTEILRHLPALPRTVNTLEFCYRYMATLMTVAGKLTLGWETLSCTAEELALHMVLDHVEFLDDLNDIGLPTHWRAFLTDCLFEDTDFLTFIDRRLPTDIDIWAPFRPGDIEVHPFQEFTL